MSASGGGKGAEGVGGWGRVVGFRQCDAYMIVLRSVNF